MDADDYERRSIGRSRRFGVDEWVQLWKVEAKQISESKRFVALFLFLIFLNQNVTKFLQKYLHLQVRKTRVFRTGDIINYLGKDDFEL